MKRTCGILLILALAASAVAEEPATATRIGADQPADGNAPKSLEFPAAKLALWQDDSHPLPANPPENGPPPPIPAAKFERLAAIPAPAPVAVDPQNPPVLIPPLPAAGPAARAANPVLNPPANPAVGPLVPMPENNSNVPFNISDSKRDTEITVMQGRSRLLRSTVDFTRTAVVDPAICDLIQYSPTELGFVGKSVGTTEVTVWFRDSDNPNVDTQPRSFIVRVEPDYNTQTPRLKQLEAEIARLFPNSKIRLRTFGRRILVLGQARDVSEAAEILDIVRGEQIDASGKWVNGPAQAETSGTAQGQETTGVRPRGPNNANNPPQGGNPNRGDWAGNVINMLKVPGVHQVMLRVKIAELDRTAARNFGANFSTNIQFNNGTLLLQSLLNASNSNSIIGSFNQNQLSFGISYLEQHGVVRFFSEPTLVTLSGKPANFIAGGEFAVPTVVGVGGTSAATTDFRAYGAIISFTPYLLDKDLLRLDIAPEFSQIGGETVGGIPGLTTRAVTTTVELRAGQTLAIAGLLDESMKSSTQADWPWIGKLIGPRSVTRNETELIVLVTPELIHPMEPEEVPPLPGFDVTEPDNIEFFLRGNIEGNPTRSYRSTVWPQLEQRYRAGGSPMISGPFGHSNEWAGDPSNSRN